MQFRHHKFMLEYLVRGLLVLALCFMQPAWAERMAFHNIYERDAEIARSLGGVNHIVQDQQGFMWFGGEKGLARFDGHRTRIYRNDRDDPFSIAHDWVRDMVVDSQGVIWIASSLGLCRYDAPLDRFACGQVHTPVALPENALRALALDKNDNLYAGTASGFYRLSRDRDEITHVTLTSPNPTSLSAYSARASITAMAVDSDSTLWIGTEASGLVAFDLNTQETRFFKADPARRNSLVHNKVQALALDGEKRLWVTTYGGGISVLNRERTSFENYVYQKDKPYGLSSNVVWDVFKDSQDIIWLAVDQSGLVRFDNEKGFVAMRHKPYDNTSLVSDQARTIFEDNNGDLWIGAFPSGVSFYNRSTGHIENFKHEPDNAESLSHTSILTIHRDWNDDIWVGTEDGLNLFDRENRTFKRYQFEHGTALTAKAVLSIAQYDSNTLWVGTWSGGLMAFDLETHEFRPIDTTPPESSRTNSLFIWDIMRDSNGNMWVASEFNGVNFYDRRSGQFQYYTHEPGDPESLPSNFAWALIEDRDGAIWMATKMGLAVLKPDEGKPQRVLLDLDDANNLHNASISGLYQDSDGRIWVGTEDNGVFIVNPDNHQYQHLNMRDGLPSTTVSSIREDALGNIWLLTTNGLVKVDGEELTLQVLGTESGLVGNNFNRNAVLRDDGGRMYFGGADGMSVFNPADLVSDLPDFPVWITDLLIMNREMKVGAEGSPLRQSITFTKSIELSHQDLMFAFEFAALDYRRHLDTRYAYKLGGFDSDWNYIGNRQSATYTNIAPGEYSFRVKASKGDGEWIESQPLQVVLKPAPWRSWWAYAIYALLLTGVGYLVINYTKLQLRTKLYKALSTTDALTGVANRMGLTQAASFLFNSEQKTSLCVVFMDIDYFKEVNDNRGHDSGDRILREVAQLLRKSLRQSDIIGRWGGEEFMLICSGVDRASGANLAEKIRRQIAAHEFDSDHSPIKITMSLGVAFVGQNDSFETVTKLADQALYRAKAVGRNRVVVGN